MSVQNFMTIHPIIADLSLDQSGGSHRLLTWLKTVTGLMNRGLIFSLQISDFKTGLNVATFLPKTQISKSKIKVSTS